EAQEQSEPDEPADIFGGVFKKAGAVHQQRNDGAEQQTERRGRKRAERKTLEHFIHGNHQPAKTEAHHHSIQAAMAHPDKFRAHLADGVAAHSAETEKQNSYGPEWSHGSGWRKTAGAFVRGGSWCQ